LNLRSRLVLILGLGLGCSLLLSLFVYIKVERRSQVKIEAERIGALLATLSAPAALSMVQGRIPDLDNMMGELGKRRHELRLEEVALVDHRGIILAHTDPQRFGGVLSSSDVFVARAVAADGPTYDYSDDGLPRRVAIPVQTGIRWGTLVATLSQPAIESELGYRAQRLSVSALLISIVALALVFLVLATFVVQPIHSLAMTANQFAAGDLTARAPVRGADEISMLAVAINEAAARLSRHTEDLETEVERRTGELQDANTALTRANEKLEKLAITDGLTGIFNHRYFQEVLAYEISRQQRGERPFSVIMADVDHFKHYNDTNGHPAGDAVLKGIAQELVNHVRETDPVARYGGEEFVILLLDADRESAVKTAEKLRRRVANHPFAHASQQPLGCVSLSMGVATWPLNGTRAEELIDAADAALYYSKRSGRNRVTAAGRPMDNEGGTDA
jgi:diguanylate cyclase (GGDEF)-like protein